MRKVLLKMALEDKLSEIREILKDLYEENFDIRDEPQIQHINRAIIELNLAINGGKDD